MNYLRILFSMLAVMIALPALSQSVENGQAEYLGELWGLAEGITATITATSKPVTIEKLPSHSENTAPTERRIYINNGLIVKVLGVSNSNGATPESVELSSPEAILTFSKGLSELTKSAVIPNLGKPTSQTANEFKYSGPAEICEEHLELFYQADQLIRVKWFFCGD